MTVIASKRLGAVAIASLLVAGGCGGGAIPTTSASIAAVEGEVSISGSSTVQPISQLVAELFNETNPNVAIAVDGPGTGDGFQLFCAGETDISDASRPISAEEAARCEEAGIEFVELKVAIDGLSILTSPNNADVTCLSFADLYALTGPESEDIDTWSGAQALATELGSTTTLPDVPLEITGPGEESGTYDYYVEAIVEEWNEDRGQDAATRKDYASSPNDSVIIQGIEGSDTSLGWVGYAFAVEAGDRVKLLEVSAPDGECVAPTPETIASNEYPLSRDLFIYVNTAKAAANPALAAYVDHYLADGTIAAVNEEVGYVDLAPEVLAESRATWEGR
ncbi:MAG TPA: substrate-binding domain-containing protein [Candidatus Limnocylindrales bacterium]|nr:substrate-binding domain-containing protein [Candidatus Limnocylindrales bacterium]